MILDGNKSFRSAPGRTRALRDPIYLHRQPYTQNTTVRRVEFRTHPRTHRWAIWKSDHVSPGLRIPRASNSSCRIDDTDTVEKNVHRYGHFSAVLLKRLRFTCGTWIPFKRNTSVARRVLNERRADRVMNPFVSLFVTPERTWIARRTGNGIRRTNLTTSYITWYGRNSYFVRLTGNHDLAKLLLLNKSMFN